MIEKLVKEFGKIRASLVKSKKLLIADIDKIDEKYRRLAQEEKKSLTESLAVLNEQLKYYDKMLDGEPVVEETDGKSEYVEPDPVEEAPEMTIQDTIFPENNEPEDENVEDREVDIDVDMPGEWAKVPEPAEKEQETKDLDAEEDEEWEQKIQSGEITEVKPEFEKKEVPVLTSDESGWGEFPADWQ